MFYHTTDITGQQEPVTETSQEENNDQRELVEELPPLFAVDDDQPEPVKTTSPMTPAHFSAFIVTGSVIGIVVLFIILYFLGYFSKAS